MSNIISLQELLNSKAVVKSGVTFNLPGSYINPFVDIVGSHNAKIDVDVQDMTENANEDRSVNTSYARALVTATLPIDEENTWKVGIVYGLDLQKPIMKVFTGTEVRACSNLTIFNAEHLSQCFITDEYKKLYQDVKKWITEKDNIIEEYKVITDRLKTTFRNKKEVHEKLGYLLEAASKKDKLLGTQVVISAAQDLFDGRSRYYIGEELTTDWNILNACTEYISSKSGIIDKANKTLSIAKYFIN